MVLEVIGSIAAPEEQNNSSGPTTMIASDTNHYRCFTHSNAKSECVGILGNIWLHRQLMRSSEALSPLLMGVLKSGVAVEEPWGAQFHDGSDSLIEGGGAMELEPRVCIWGMTGARVEVVGAGLE